MTCRSAHVLFPGLTPWLLKPIESALKPRIPRWKPKKRKHPENSHHLGWVPTPLPGCLLVANEGLRWVGIPDPKNGSCHPGGDEPASWERTINPTHDPSTWKVSLSMFPFLLPKVTESYMALVVWAMMKTQKSCDLSQVQLLSLGFIRGWSVNQEDFFEISCTILLMVQKSGVHQLRLVVYPIIYKVLYMPVG